MSKIYSSREVVQLLTVKHHHKSGIVTVPHPKKQIGRGLFHSILKQAQLKERT